MTLLWSSLLVSSNDSATALAIDAGGGSLDRFYALMNAKARSLGMEHTMYASASGLNDSSNLSTALDQAILARHTEDPYGDLQRLAPYAVVVQVKTDIHP